MVTNVDGKTQVDASKVNVTEQITSTLATGTAPLSLASTTKVANLNVEQVDGYDLNQSVSTTGTPRFSRLSINTAFSDAEQFRVSGTSILDATYLVGGFAFGVFPGSTPKLSLRTSNGYSCFDASDQPMAISAYYGTGIIRLSSYDLDTNPMPDYIDFYIGTDNKRTMTINRKDFEILTPSGSIILTPSNGTVFTPSGAPASPTEGMLYYDSTAHKLKVYTGAAWETVTSAV